MIYEPEVERDKLRAINAELLAALRQCFTDKNAHCLAYGTDTPKLRARLMAINSTIDAAIAKATEGQP